MTFQMPVGTFTCDQAIVAVVVVVAVAAAVVCLFVCFFSSQSVPDRKLLEALTTNEGMRDSWQLVKVKVHVDQITAIERVIIEYRKTKTKVITLTNHNRCKQRNEPIRTRNKYM